MKPISISLTKKVSLIFILSFTTLAAIDSTIVKFYSTSGEELPPSSNVMIFVLFATIFAISGYILLNSVKADSRRLVYKLPSKIRYLYGLIVATQTFMVIIIVTIIFQILSANKYNVILLQASTYVTHISALVFLILLVIIFVRWLRSRRTFISVLYTIAFALVSVTILISMIYLQAQFSVTINPDRKPFPINTYVIRQETKPYVEVLGTTIDVLSFSSFLAMWLATIALLTKYKFKLGRVRYFTLITIPLIYYVFPFEAYFGNLFSPLILTSPVNYSMLYVLIFSATKQVGALLFSLAFLTAASLVSQTGVKKSLLLTSIGIALLFGSMDVVSLQYRLFPPFGLITEAFMPLGSYLLFIGIFASAISVSRDATLRKEFYKSAESQLGLLKTIGVTQMENELLKEYKPILNRSKILEKYVDQNLEQPDVNEIIRDVLNELQSREINIKNGPKSNHK
jgi:hypothetical protein